MAPGRNEPCPCGSGRKFKHCCLGRDSTAPDPGRAPWSDDDRNRAVALLDRFLDRDEMGDARQDAFSVFWGPVLAEPVDEEHAKRVLQEPTSQLCCVYWTLFDYRLDDDQRVVDRFLGRFPQRLGAGERRWLEAMRDSTVRLWEVRDVQPGEGFTAVDLWEGRRVVKVRGRDAAEEPPRWMVLAARLLEAADGVHQIEGPVLAFAPTEKRALLRDVRRDRRRIRKESPALDDDDFFEILCPLIHDHWVQVVADAPPPRLVTSDGDAMLFGRVIFDVLDHDALRDALDADPQFEAEAVDDEDGQAPTSWAWLEPGDPGAPRRGLGHLELASDRLTLETFSRPRAESGRALLEDLVPGALRHRGTSFEDPHQAIAHAPETGSDESGLPFEEEARLMQEIKDAHYRGWLDEPIPALDGRTPREAARVKSARPDLVALLKELEIREEHAGRAGQPVYDATWIWKELGLRRR